MVLGTNINKIKAKKATTLLYHKRHNCYHKQGIISIGIQQPVSQSYHAETRPS